MTVSRSFRIPRSAWALAALLLLAVAILFLVRSRKPADDFTLGGTIVSFAADRIEGMVVTKGGVQHRLDRNEAGHWLLTGATTDFVGDKAMADFLRDLTGATGGALLPGTEPEDRRYEFNGPEAIRLTIFGPDDDRTSLVTGAENPVTKLVYASGAGRRTCFPVTSAFRQRLAGLPHSVRSKQLLPLPRRDLVTGLTVTGAGRETRLERREGRWWLRLDERGPAGLCLPARRYHEIYADRRFDDEQGTWVRAAEQKVGLLLYQISASLVRSYLPGGDAAAMDLDPPWRHVVLSGQGVNPAPASGSADKMEISFGVSSDGKRIPVRRLQGILLTDITAVATVELPAADFVDARALGFPAVQMDSLTASIDGKVVLRAHHDRAVAAAEIARKGGDSDQFEGRKAWFTDYLAPGQSNLGQRDRDVVVRSLIIDLDRIPIWRVLPPTDEPRVLAEKERCRLVLRGVDGDAARTEVFDVGWLQRDYLPAGSAELQPSTDEHPVAGLWVPDTGQLLQVPPQTIITLRNLGVE